MTFLKTKPKPNPAPLKRLQSPQDEDSDYPLDPAETYWKRYVEENDAEITELVHDMWKKAQEDLDREQMIQDLKDMVEGNEQE